MKWLGHDARSAGVLATAKMYMEIERTIRAILPGVLAEACRVSKVDAQRLQLAVPSPAHAAKLRQLGPSIGRALSSRGWNVETIDVVVSATLQTLGAPKQKPPKEAVPLEPSALEAFSTLHDSLRPGPLANAVARLLTHHKAKP